LSRIRDLGVNANDKAIVNNNVIELNEANFDREVLNATQPVLVEFWAGWSDPCKAMAPLLEARESNSHQIGKFKLDGFLDFFISSCFVHLRKPDADIFRLALDIAQVPVKEILYIENTPMFVQIAEGLGIRSILHSNYRATCAKLASFGLSNHEEFLDETC
jgi:hypothetical protein